MASTKGGQRLSVSPTREWTGLNACAGIALNQSGTPSAAGTGGGSNPSSSIGQRNVSESSCCGVMFFSKAWTAWVFDACSVELYDAGDTFGIVPAQSRVADLAVDLFEALIAGPAMDRSAGRAE